MGKVFEQGSFRKYSEIRLDKSRETIRHSAQYGEKKITVFVSHKHDDLGELKGVIGFLEKEYGVSVYIDSRDPSMPLTTSAITANNLKNRICECDKFILLATNGAIESKWCNWELGFGDAQKYKAHIALLPLKPEGANDSAYKGSEYMSIYPYIKYSDGTDRKLSGGCFAKGYYVVTPNGDGATYTLLENWFANK